MVLKVWYWLFLVRKINKFNPKGDRIEAELKGGEKVKVLMDEGNKGLI
ncbi:MAG: hypothetical protein QXM43_09905 [Desulfurococcaceae archaeon]